MHKLLPGCMLILLSFAACQSGGSTETIDGISKTLDKASEVIIDNNEAVYSDLNNKFRDPQTRRKAELWRPKVFAVKELSDEVSRYIRSLKRQLVAVKKDDESGVRELFQKEGDSLYNKLARYNNNVVKTVKPEEFDDNPSFKEHLLKDIESFKKDIAGRSGIELDSSTERPVNYQQWKKAYQQASTLTLGIAILNKMQNDVLAIEYDLINYMNNYVGSNIGHYEVFHALAGLNSSYVKTGQLIEVKVGIGMLSVVNKPTITIDGSVVKVDDEGVATYKLNTNQRPGKYNVLVKIEYTKPDGSTAFITKNLEYIIAE